MYYYYYYYYGPELDAQYTVFRTHPVYPYLSVFLNKIFFLESEIVENNRNLFSEVYDLFEDEELKKFDFFKIPLTPNEDNNSIISEISIKSNLNTKEFELLKRFYSRQNFCKSYYQEFIKAIKDLFSFKNIHQGGLLWFEPHIHGYKVIFMSAEKFISNQINKNLKGMFLNRLDISKLLENVNNEIKDNKVKTSKSNEGAEAKENNPVISSEEASYDSEQKETHIDIPSEKKRYSDFLQNALRLMDSDFKSDANLKEFILLLSTLNDITKNEFKKDRNRLVHKINIIDEDGHYKIFVPDIEEEIEMAPATKAVYFLSLLKPEGISFEDLESNQDVLKTFYMSFSPHYTKEEKEIIKTIENISTNPKEISTQKSRTKDSFLKVICEENKMFCKEITQELIYKKNVSGYSLKLDKTDIGGYEKVFEFANGLNGFKL